MSDEKPNGTYSYTGCGVSAEWQEFLQDFADAKKSYKELHEVVGLILANTAHLIKLPELTDNVKTLNTVIENMQTNLLAPAVGKDRVPTDTVQLLLEAQNKNARYVFWLLGSVIVSLIVILGLLLTGEKIGVIEPLQHKIIGVP